MPERCQFTIRKVKAEDAFDVADIFNEGIDERCATFSTVHVTVEEIRFRIVNNIDSFPFLVAVSKRSSRVVGWVSISAYSQRPFYRGVGEVSLYIQKCHRRQGVGGALLEAVFEEAAKQGYWKLMAKIFMSNEASKALFKKQGYSKVGVHRKHGKLEGEWLDVLEVEKSIPSNLT